MTPLPDLLRCRCRPGTAHIIQYWCCKNWFSAEAFPVHAAKRHALSVTAARALRERSRAAYRDYLTHHVPPILPTRRRTEAATALLYVCCEVPFPASTIVRHLMAHGLSKDAARVRVRLSKQAFVVEQNAQKRCATCDAVLLSHPRCQSCEILLHGDDTSPCAWCLTVRGSSTVPPLDWHYASALTWESIHDEQAGQWVDGI